MAADTLKEQARSRDLKVGHFIVEFATPGIGHMLKNAGCDFVLFDTEHSGFHNETIKSVIRYFEAARLPVICRVPSKEYHHIARAADMGAEGIMLPMVNDAKEARHVLDCMKYVPDGQRGVALGVAHDHYRGGAVLDKLAAANARTTFFAQIETRAGVENADAIAATRRRRLPVGRPFRPVLVAGHSRPVRAQGIPRCDRHGGEGLPQARQGHRPSRARRRHRAPTTGARASTTSAIRATSGPTRPRSRPASTASAPPAEAAHEPVPGRAERRLQQARREPDLPQLRPRRR